MSRIIIAQSRIRTIDRGYFPTRARRVLISLLLLFIYEAWCLSSWKVGGDRSCSPEHGSKTWDFSPIPLRVDRDFEIKPCWPSDHRRETDAWNLVSDVLR